LNLTNVSTSCDGDSSPLKLHGNSGWLVLRRFLGRNWEILLLCFVLALQFFSGDLFVLASRKTTSYLLLNNSIAFLAYLRQYVVPAILPILIAAVFVCLFFPLTPRRRRLLIDGMFILIVFRLCMLFSILNLMIFLPPSDRILLFSQLLLFLPCLLLIWGWIYWRVDTYTVSMGRGRIFTSSTSEDAIPPAYDYFIAAFTSLLTTTLDNFNGKTRFARTLMFLHGFMMWDIMALTLSRAIALASS